MALGRSTEQGEERPRADRDHVGRANVADVVSEVLLLEPALEPRVGEAKRREMESRGAATHDGAASLRLRTIPLRRREREVDRARLPASLERTAGRTSGTFPRRRAPRARWQCRTHVASRIRSDASPRAASPTTRARLQRRTSSFPTE